MFISKDLTAASSIPLVLSILKLGDNYGYAIIKIVREYSGDEIQWTEGMLYPVLHKLEEQGMIRSYWQESDTGRKRKYYALSKEGEKGLDDMRLQWDKVHTTLNGLWKNLFSEEGVCLI